MILFGNYLDQLAPTLHSSRLDSEQIALTSLKYIYTNQIRRLFMTNAVYLEGHNYQHPY